MPINFESKPIKQVIADFDGNGDMRVGLCSYDVLQIITGEPAEIGEPAEFDKDSPRILLRFAKPESIDVVIEKLRKIKMNLIEPSFNAVG